MLEATLKEQEALVAEAEKRAAEAAEIGKNQDAQIQGQVESEQLKSELKEARDEIKQLEEIINDFHDTEQQSN